MDAVITYVNGTDPVWQQQYCNLTKQPALTKRYRDWGLLPYLLRGIEKYMPFINKVFLVVASESQVPQWIDTQQVYIVYHRDIIPQEYLPTFNSGTIEIFLHRIKGLDEQFIYFNDDIFPLQPLSPDGFFKEEKITTHIAYHLLAPNKYKQRAKRADRWAQYAALQSKNIKRSNKCLFIRPQHTCTPMLKSLNEEALAAAGNEFLQYVSPIRTALNPNQYFFTDYLYYTGKVINRRILTKHCSMAIYSPERIAKLIMHPVTPLICINDVAMNETQEEQMRHQLHQAFQQRFPLISHFEKK